jgi:hypothetical protein
MDMTILGEVFDIAMKAAAASLSAFLGKDVHIKTTNTELISLTEGLECCELGVKPENGAVVANIFELSIEDAPANSMTAVLSVSLAEEIINIAKKALGLDNAGL